MQFPCPPVGRNSPILSVCLCIFVLIIHMSIGLCLFLNLMNSKCNFFLVMVRAERAHGGYRLMGTLVFLYSSFGCSGATVRELHSLH